MKSQITRSLEGTAARRSKSSGNKIAIADKAAFGGLWRSLESTGETSSTIEFTVRPSSLYRKFGGLVADTHGYTVSDNIIDVHWCNGGKTTIYAGSVTPSGTQLRWRNGSIWVKVGELPASVACD